MDLSELKNRITKKQEQIAKLEKKVARLTVNDPYNDLHRAEVSLKEARLTLEKYNNMLKVEEAKANTKKIDVIWNFLLEYKAKVREYLNDNTKWKHEYYRLNSIYCDMYNSHKYTRDQLNEVYKQEKEAHSNVHPYVDKYYSIRKGWNETELEKQLIKDITNQYFDLIERVTKITGEITNATNLDITFGELNGIVIGIKGKAKVETIGAGGYNIQCFHYRTLIKEVK